LVLLCCEPYLYNNNGCYTLSCDLTRHMLQSLGKCMWYMCNPGTWLPTSITYRGADKSLAQPGRKQANASVRMAWISLGALPCKKRNLMTACISILLKTCTSLTYFRACFFPGWAKDLTAPRHFKSLLAHLTSVNNSTLPVTYESYSSQQKPEKERTPSACPLRYEGDTASHADWRMSDRSFNKQSIHLFKSPFECNDYLQHQLQIQMYSICRRY